MTRASCKLGNASCKLAPKSSKVTLNPKWDFIYKVAADIPWNPSKQTQRAYHDFFKSLVVVLPDRDERLVYRKLVKDGPFKLTSDVFSSGPLKTLQWIVDVRNGILQSLKRPSTDNVDSLWGLLEDSRSKRNALNAALSDFQNDQNLHLTRITSATHLQNFTSGRLSIVMFDKIHFILLIPRSDVTGATALSHMKARFGVDAAIVPGNLSYRWFYSLPFSGTRVSTFPWFRLYQNGKVVIQSKDAKDIERFLEARTKRKQNQII